MPPNLSVVSDTTDMPLYSAMCKAILDCRHVDEVAKLQDDVKRQLYGQQIKDGNTMKTALNEIYLRAERQLGVLLAALPRQDRPSRYDTRSGAGTAPNTESKRKIMGDNGITPRRGSRAERIASIPKKEFEEEVKKPKASIRKLSDYAKSKEPPRPQKPEPKWSDPHLDAQVKLLEGLHRISEGLKTAAFGMKIKDAVLEVMLNQGTNLPAVDNELRKIKAQLVKLEPLWIPMCPCPFKSQKAISVVKDAIDA